MQSDSDDAVLRRIEALEKATDKRLDDARDIHRREHEAAEQAHHAVHDAHAELHVVEKEQRDMARLAMDRRLEGMNEIRSQLNLQASTFQTLAAATAVEKGLNARIDAASKHTDERYEENRRRIETLEKGDVKQEGKQLGQGAILAVIVGVVSFVGTVLGIVIVISNFATATP